MQTALLLTAVVQKMPRQGRSVIKVYTLSPQQQQQNGEGMRVESHRSVLREPDRRRKKQRNFFAAAWRMRLDFMCNMWEAAQVLAFLTLRRRMPSRKASFLKLQFYTHGL
ncbi:hypothetical protein TcG_00217 [Trypanosoma cruzi]|nr:hypothetical protein TcBrA4_0103890 [Trypanosoma cruzi]RNF25215.1 hypothetical protein TcG_00217 [Trypanosoma cruzi]